MGANVERGSRTGPRTASSRAPARPSARAAAAAAAAALLLLFGVAARAGGAARLTDAKAFLSNGTRAHPPAAAAARPDEACAVAVVGAAYGGAYFAHRLVESGVATARDICVFEASEHRVGGRVYSVGNLPSPLKQADGLLTVDVGAYRYVPSQKLISGLIEKSLALNTSCYYPVTCDDGRRVVTDASGLNNVGYARPIATVLDRLAARGTRVYYGRRLLGLYGGGGRARSLRLSFSGGARATARTVLLNIPSEAVARLDLRGFPGAHVGPEGGAALQIPRTPVTTKVYAQYADAWWITKLGRLRGDFADRALPVLAGRYHDGAAACFRGRRQVPLSEAASADRCTGLLLVAYFGQSDLAGWRQYAAYQATDDPLTIVADGAGQPGQALLDAVHARLVDFHAAALRAAGVDPASLAKPHHLYMGTWRANNTLTASLHEWPYFVSGMTLAAAAKASVRPAPQLRVFLANEAFGPSPGWAEGSLVMAERVLAKHFNAPPPVWLADRDYYRRVVLNYTYFDELTVQLFGHPLPVGSPDLSG